MTNLRVDESALVVMARCAESAYPDEVCGLLVGARSDAGVTVQRAEPVANIAGRPARHYAIHVRDLLALEDRLDVGQELVGVFHSHPDGPAVPSPSDELAATSWPGLVQAIVPVIEGRAGPPRFYRPTRSAEPCAAGLVESCVGGGALLSSAGS